MTTTLGPASLARASAATSAAAERWGLPAALAALAALAYVPLCAPVSGMGDSSEFTLVLATNGVAHPTGYPLYTIFGHLFCVALRALGIGWSLAAAFWSAVGGALAVFFLAAASLEWASWAPGAVPAVRRLAPALPVLLFAVQPAVLGEATRAEINAWSLAWVCAALFVFLRLAARVGLRGARASRRDAALWGVVCGLGVAHHLTSVLVSGPLSAGLLATLARRRALRVSLVAIAVGWMLVPLMADLVIVWRAWHPARVQWPLLEPSLRSVLDHLTAREYRGFLGSFHPSSWQKELLAKTIAPFLVPGLALLAFGLARARPAEEKIAWGAALAAALAGTVFAFRYGVDDPAPYFLGPMAIGVAAAAPAIASIRGLTSRAGAAALAAAGLASLFVIVPWVRDGAEERQATIAFEHLIRSMWSSVPPDTAIVSWTDDRFNRLVEYQVLRGEKPAVLVVTPDLLLGGRIRDEIIRRFGADPRAGFHPLGAASNDPEALQAARRGLVRRLNDHVRVPVILFDPTVPIVWEYRKPWESRAAPSAPPAHWSHPSFGPRPGR